MNYQPILKTLIPSGEYNFKVIKSLEGLSKAGKPMLTLTVSVWDENDHKTTIPWRCLLDSGFLRSVAQGCGLLEKYESGKLEAYDFDNKEGKCLVEVEDKGLYEKTNIIQTFYAKKEENKTTQTDSFEDDVPF
jgi:hypothetical protein